MSVECVLGSSPARNATVGLQFTMIAIEEGMFLPASIACPRIVVEECSVLRPLVPLKAPGRGRDLWVSSLPYAALHSLICTNILLVLLC